MVLLNRIYTRAGDGGATRLASGEKVSKASARVAAYGEVDELNSVVGLARLETAADDILERCAAGGELLLGQGQIRTRPRKPRFRL